MSQLKEILIEELQDLLHAEIQLTKALPQMAEAAHNPKLKEAFEKHLIQTEGHVERLKQAFELLGKKVQAKPCKAMMGLIEEARETIEEGGEKENLAADLSLIVAAQKIEHYEISGYGTVRSLARLIGEKEVTHLLSNTLSDEETADFLLTETTKPLLQELRSEDLEEEHRIAITGKELQFRLVFNHVPSHKIEEFVSQLAEAISVNGGQIHAASSHTRAVASA